MILFNYVLRNMRARIHLSLAASFGVAVVVFVLSGSSMLKAGLRKMVDSEARAEDAIVLGSMGGEITSAFVVEKGRAVETLETVARSGDGTPVASEELLVTLTLPSMKDGVPVNSLVRGFTPRAMLFHPRFAMIEGRLPAPSSDEAIIGRSVVGRFRGLGVGQTIKLGRQHEFKIVGVFADGGGFAESEVWVNLASAQSAFSRPGTISTLNVRLRSASDFGAFKSQVEHDKRMMLATMQRIEYNDAQSMTLTVMITVLTLFISVFFGVSAVLGASVAIYGSVANRIREFGTFRALGFPRRTILIAVLCESTLLTLMGGAVGSALALVLAGREFSFQGPNWGQVVFKFELTPMMLVNAVIAAFAFGLLGGLMPALRASRVMPSVALRS